MGCPSVNLDGNVMWRRFGENHVGLLSPFAQQRLTGNAIHAGLCFAWLLYVHSNTIRRDLVEKWMPITIMYKTKQQKEDDEAAERARHMP